MSTFDLAVGMDSSSMDKASQVVYQKLYPTLFTGSQNVNYSGVDFSVSWDVQSSPTFILSPPSNSEVLLRAHLLHWQNSLPVTKDAVTQALLTELQNNVLQMSMDNVVITLKSNVSSGTDLAKLVIYVQANAAGGTMTLVPLKAVGTVSNPSDEWFLNNVILPEAMKMAASLLQGIQLPPLQFSGVSLTAPDLIVTENHVIALANLLGQSVPQPPFSITWPTSPFFALMSEVAKVQVARQAVQGLVGKSFGHQGSVDIGLGEAYYTAQAMISHIDIGDGGGADVSFAGVIQGNVAVGIKVGCVKFGLNYNLYAKPNPAGIISLSISGDKTLRATTSRLNTFVLVLEPTGNPVEWILSALTDPLLQTVTAVFSPLISSAFNGIAFDVYTVPSIPINIEGLSFTVVPQQVSLSSFAGLLALNGTVNVSS